MLTLSRTNRLVPIALFGVLAISRDARADDPHPTAPAPAAPAPAPAAPPTIQVSALPPEQLNTFTMRNGTVVRGWVVTLRPGELVEITPESGANVRLPWNDIVQAIGPSFPNGYRAGVTPPPTAYAPPPGYALPPDLGGPPVVDVSRPGPGRVPLVIIAPARVDIGVATSEVYQGASRIRVNSDHLCYTPCTLYVPPARINFTAQAAHSQNDYVHVEVGPSGARARLHLPPGWMFPASIITIGAGAATFGVGAVLAFVNFHSTNNTGVIVGGIGIGVGAAAGITGAILNRLNRVTLEGTDVPEGIGVTSFFVAPTEGGGAAGIVGRF